MSFSKIAVVGAGNIGTQFACLSAEKGYDTVAFSSRASGDGLLEIVDGDTVVHSGRVSFISDYRLLSDRDVVFVTYPSFLFAELGKELAKVLKSGSYLCVLPGTGGAEFFFSDCVKKGVALCGLQRVPGVARLVEYGKRVRVSGLRDKLFLGSIPVDAGEAFASFLSDLVGIECAVLPNYLCVTMTPSNPILHTTRLRTMFADYVEGKTYDKNPLFYGEWTEESAALLLACDAEHQRILRAFDEMDLTSVRSLVEHYDGSDTPQKMAAKLRGIASLHDLLSPMIKTEKGWVPDFTSRYFSADFPFGLAIIEAFAKVANVPVEHIAYTMDWYRAVTGDKRVFSLADFGIETVEDVYRYYLQTR